MNVAFRTDAVDQLSELARQTGVLFDNGYPALAGLSEDAFRALVVPLERHLPSEQFVLVVTGAVVPLARLIGLTALRGKPGFTTMGIDDLAKFRPTEQLPTSAAYLLVDVDTGKDTLSVRPDDALPRILAAGRTPLTLDEGLAVVTQHPEWLVERNSFEMLGSTAGDKRVTGLWLSKGAPRLGWCWMGNPHTWLGMASAARRVG